jgi:hypothetical protein
VVWCGVVWCGVVWCGAVWCGVVCVHRLSESTKLVLLETLISLTVFHEDLSGRIAALFACMLFSKFFHIVSECRVQLVRGCMCGALVDEGSICCCCCCCWLLLLVAVVAAVCFLLMERVIVSEERGRDLATQQQLDGVRVAVCAGGGRPGLPSLRPRRARLSHGLHAAR